MERTAKELTRKWILSNRKAIEYAGPASLPGVDLKAIPIYDYVTCYWSFAAAKETVHAAHVCVVPLLAGARKVEYVYLEIDSINEEFDVSEFDPLVFTCGKDVLMLVVFRCEEKQQKLILGSHFIRGENRLMILAFEKVTEELENLVKELLIHVIRQASSSLELVLVTDFAQLNLEAMEHKSDVQLILPKFCTFMDKCFIWSCIAHHTILQGGRLDSLINLSPACVSVLPFKYMHILSERVSTISNAEFLNYSQSLLGHDQKELFSAWHSRIMCKLESDADAYNRQFERYTLRGSETKKTKPEGERPNAFQPEKIGAQYMRIHLASKQDEFVTIGLPIELFADCSMKQLESLSDWRSKNKQDVFVQTPSREISVDLYRNEHKKRAQQTKTSSTTGKNTLVPVFDAWTVQSFFDWANKNKPFLHPTSFVLQSCGFPLVWMHPKTRMVDLLCKSEYDQLLASRKRSTSFPVTLAVTLNDSSSMLHRCSFQLCVSFSCCGGNDIRFVSSYANLQVDLKLLDLLRAAFSEVFESEGWWVCNDSSNEWLLVDEHSTLEEAFQHAQCGRFEYPALMPTIRVVCEAKIGAISSRVPIIPSSEVFLDMVIRYGKLVAGSAKNSITNSFLADDSLSLIQSLCAILARVGGLPRVNVICEHITSKHRKIALVPLFLNLCSNTDGTITPEVIWSVLLLGSTSSNRLTLSVDHAKSLFTNRHSVPHHDLSRLPRFLCASFCFESKVVSGLWMLFRLCFTFISVRSPPKNPTTSSSSSSSSSSFSTPAAAASSSFPSSSSSSSSTTATLSSSSSSFTPATASSSSSSSPSSLPTVFIRSKQKIMQPVSPGNYCISLSCSSTHKY